MRVDSQVPLHPSLFPNSLGTLMYAIEAMETEGICRAHAKTTRMRPISDAER